MTPFLVAISLRWRKCLDAAATILLVLIVLASLPFLLGFFVPALGWLCGLFHRPDDLWKECPWCF